MQKLKHLTKLALQLDRRMPFSVYTSYKEQAILNVPISKPVLICVLDGCKKLGGNEEAACPSGSFVFLSNSVNVNMRNITGGNEYFALLIEFDYTDFDCFTHKETESRSFIQGEIILPLAQTLHQFVEWATFAPAELWHLRKQEILHTLYHLGFTEVSAIVEPPNLASKLHGIISADLSHDWTMDVLSKKLAMSESTVRRKLLAEGTSLQAIKDRAKLGYGLHLVQSTFNPISHIAQQCGYASQSRFTDKFKQLFGITPTALRKTRVID